MTMTVTSKHSLDDMESWVTEKFAAIENKDVVVPNLVEPHPFPKENLCKVVKFVPVKDEHKLSVYWILPYL